MKFPSVLLLVFALFSCSDNGKKNENWIPLFNGKDLTGWDIKIKGYPLNVNFNNTFRVEDGVIKVSYDEYTKFNAEYGHLFYRGTFSHYKLRLEYRFTGEQAPGGQAWAYRNSGVMLHGQEAGTMGIDQDFPVSLEAQFLGGDGKYVRHTGNICTPGTHIVMNGELITQHCNESTSDTYHGDVWVKAEFVVLGDSIIHHIIEGDTVMTYSKPQIGDAPAGYPLPEGTPVDHGTISFQSESHPVEFRKIELLDLSVKK